MCVIVLILLAMALGLSALFLLAKAQKENLGKLYSVSAYVVLTVSILIIVFSIAAAIIHCCHKSGGKCGKHGTEQGCGKDQGSCSMMKGSCESDGNSGATNGSCSSKSSGSCSKGKGGMHCGGGNSDCMMMNPHGGKTFEKKIVKMIDGDSAHVDVKVITK